MAKKKVTIANATVLTLYLEREVLEQYRAKANEEKTSVSELIRELMREGLNDGMDDEERELYRQRKAEQTPAEERTTLLSELERIVGRLKEIDDDENFNSEFI